MTASYLIVNADDFGYCQQRNKGIIQCIEKNIVTSISLLVNGQAANDIELLKNISNKLSIGLHFNISEGYPCSSISLIPTLLNEQNCFLGKFNLHDAAINGKISKQEVEIELRAQIECFKKLVNISPTHIDGHQHIHILPGIREVFGKVLQSENIIWTRIPIDNKVNDCNWFENSQKIFYTKIISMADESQNIFKKHGLKYAENFIGITLMGKHMTLLQLKDAVTKNCKHKRNTLCEMMVHPGYASIPGIGGCGEGPDDFALSKEREHEMNILCHPDLKLFLENAEIRLISFSEINLALEL